MPEPTTSSAVRRSRGFVHPKWRFVRPRIPTVHTVGDIVADPVLQDQILSTIDPPIDFAALCRAIDPGGLREHCRPVPA